MNAPPEMRSPAPALASGMDRAGIVRNNNIDTTSLESTEAFAAEYVARRCRVTLPMARVVVALAGIARRIA